MNKEYLEKNIKCIKCQSALKVDYYQDESGMINCTNCNSKYPIIKNIPRLLSGKLLLNCLCFYENIIKKDDVLVKYFQEKLNDSQVSKNKINQLKSDTQKQFGYEWHIWKKLPEFAENHFLEVMNKPNDFFQGKIGWDPAIGMGRDLANAAKAVGENGFMIGSDLSFSVDMAYERCQKLNLKNILIIQADLYSDFIDNNSLDFAYMIGLIQHITEPSKGIEHVYGKIKNRGYFVGTVYTEPTDILSKFLVSFIYFMRFFTLHLPLPVVLFISRICAFPAYVFFKMPSFILKRFSYIRSMDDLYPTHETQKRKPDLNLLAHNWFDHFTPPIIGFYSDEKIIKMTENAKLDDFKLKLGIFSGYKK